MTSHVTADRTPIAGLLLVLWTCALTAAVGNSLHVIWWSVLHEGNSGASPDFVFLAPIGYLVVFGFVGVPCVLLSRLLPAGLANRIAPALLAGLAAFALVLLLKRLHPAALLLLAVGAGARVGASFGHDPHRALAWTRRVALAVTVVAAVLPAATAVARWRRAQQWTPGPVASTDAPNVILLILDTVRAANLSLYGYVRPTSPVIERLAARGVTFDYAFSSTSWSAPSHATMMTGRWGSQTGADFKSRASSELHRLPAALAQRGYASGGFVANFVYAGRGAGIADGFTHFEDFPRNLEQALLSTTLTQTGSGFLLMEGIRTRTLYRVVNALRHPRLRFVSYREASRTSAEIVERFWRWRDALEDQRPYFALVNLMDAHDPYEPPGRFRTLFGDGTKPLDRYDGSIAYLDSLIGEMDAGLRARGEGDRTILIITADHGELWGEHGIEGHSSSVYLPVVHVPLVISGAALPAGRRVTRVVSLRDLPSTILDLAGGDASAFPGQSLRQTWATDSGRAASPVIVEASPGINVENITRFGPIRSAIDSAWHYIVYGNGTEELFAWRADPGEQHNLIDTPEGRDVASRLRRVIERELGPEALRQPRAASPGKETAGPR